MRTRIRQGLAATFALRPCRNPRTCDQPASDAFAFRINRDAFLKVLGFARSLQSQLSANPDDYILANFHFNNEIYLGAELGLSLANYKLELFGY